MTAVLLFLLPWLLSSPPAKAESPTVVVVSVGDGDTLRLRQGSRLLTVRLACIDAPERWQTPHGQVARAALQALAPPGSLMELRRKTSDRYGRTVAELRRSGQNINQRLVASGAAFVYWPYLRGCDRETYARLEAEARLQRLGVWSVPGGISRPWDVRKQKAGHGNRSGSLRQEAGAAARQNSQREAAAMAAGRIVCQTRHTPLLPAQPLKFWQLTQRGDRAAICANHGTVSA